MNPQRVAVERRRVRRPEEGFTLLEFIIAFVLLALMATAMYSTFRVALNSYRTSQERLETRARSRVLQDLVRRQVGSLFPLRPTAAFLETEMDPMAMMPEDLEFSAQSGLLSQIPLFYGTNESMTFVTIAPLRMLVNPGLTVVRYGLAEDEWGRRYLGAMEARFVGLETFQMMVDIPSGKPYALVEGISQLRFEYYGFDAESMTYQWFEEWFGDMMREVPSAVRITTDKNSFVIPINATSMVNPGGGSTLQDRRNARVRALQALEEDEQQ